jgi:hypothetical protein
MGGVPCGMQWGNHCPNHGGRKHKCNGANRGHTNPCMCSCGDEIDFVLWPGRPGRGSQASQ